MQHQTPSAQPQWQQIFRAALGFSLITLVLFGLAYSASATLLGQLLFPVQANGSLIVHQQQVLGSQWVAQPFTQAQYFHPRPSAAQYDTMAMAGSNLAQSNPVLAANIDAQVQQRIQLEQVNPAQIPADLVTTSASGIDPEISLEAALIQVQRVATARQMSVAQVEHLLMQQHLPAIDWLAVPARVNVLQLNVALDQQQQLLDNKGLDF